METAIKSRRWLRVAIAGTIWLTFIFISLPVAYVAVWTLCPPIWLASCLCVGCIAWGIKNGAHGGTMRRVGFAAIGAVTGGLAAALLDIVAFPANGWYGIVLIVVCIAASEIGSCAGVFIARKLERAPLPGLRDIPRHMPFILVSGFSASVLCVTVSLVLFRSLGIPGVYVGMAGMELHARLKTDLPALRNWLATEPPNEGDVPKESWPEAIQRLRPTNISVYNGRLYLRFQYSRLHDYTLTVRPSNQCSIWYEAMETGYVEH